MNNKMCLTAGVMLLLVLVLVHSPVSARGPEFVHCSEFTIDNPPWNTCLGDHWCDYVEDINCQLLCWVWEGGERTEETAYCVCENGSGEGCDPES